MGLLWNHSSNKQAKISAKNPCNPASSNNNQIRTRSSQKCISTKKSWSNLNQTRSFYRDFSYSFSHISLSHPITWTDFLPIFSISSLILSLLPTQMQNGNMDVKMETIILPFGKQNGLKVSRVPAQTTKTYEGAWHQHSPSCGVSIMGVQNQDKFCLMF